jgi:hypothetical protein
MLDAAIDLADAIQPPPPPRVRPKPEPQPEKPLSPLVVERQIEADIERADRNRRSREHSERVAEHRQRRFKNRGTLG